MLTTRWLCAEFTSGAQGDDSDSSDDSDSDSEDEEDLITRQTSAADRAMGKLLSLTLVQNAKFHSVEAANASWKSCKSCSISDSTFRKVVKKMPKEDEPKLVQFSSTHLVRCYPSAARVLTSSNMAPSRAWSTGTWEFNDSVTNPGGMETLFF